MAPATGLVRPDLLGEYYKEQHTFADTVALAAGPKASPFLDRQALTR
jgi:hypothetical protein